MPLEKKLGFWDVFSLASGAMISSGIFILPGLAYAQAGPGVFLSYLLAGCFALIGILCVIELATAMPRAGGSYLFVARSLGPMMGSLSGILSWFALALKSAFALFGLAEVIYLFTGWPLPLLLAVLTAAFALLNILGVDLAARLEGWLVALLLGVLLFYGFYGSTEISFSHFSLLYEGADGAGPIFMTAAFVFVSFGGLLNVASLSEEVKNPGKILPAGLLSAVVVITLVYGVIIFVTVGILPGEELAGSLTPLTDAAVLLWGLPGGAVMTAAAVMAFVTTANAGIMAASRFPVALSRDSLLPEFLQGVWERKGTPVPAVLATCLLIGLTLMLPLDLLVKAASTVIMTAYLLTALAVIVMRESRIQNYRPLFKVPLYPLLPVVTVLLFGFLVVYMGLAAVEMSLALLGIAFLVYFFYGRTRRRESEYALLHLTERAVNRDLTARGLEDELRGIIQERDELVSDEIDRLFLEAKVLDVEERIDREGLFERAAEILAEPAALSREDLIRLLHQREEQSSTVLMPEVAVPHIVHPAEGAPFVLGVIRGQQGIAMSEKPGETDVKAVFVLIGSPSDRGLHLKCLAALAQIVQQPDFLRRWKAARGSEDLRDMLRISRRWRAKR